MNPDGLETGVVHGLYPAMRPITDVLDILGDTERLWLFEIWLEAHEANCSRTIVGQRRPA